MARNRHRYAEADAMIARYKRRQGQPASPPSKAHHPQRRTRSLPQKRGWDFSWMQPALMLTAGLAVLFFFAYQHVNILSPQCRVKANVSDSGRIYHVPGQQYYGATRINQLMGERWFCSEADARAAGWRRSMK